MKGDSFAQLALPRSWNYAVAGAVAVAAVVTATNLPRLHVYLKYWGTQSPRIDMPYKALSRDMDEKALRATMSTLPLNCIAEDKARNGLGDRVCYSALNAADGAPALTAAFFFDDGRLAHAIVQVPWWGHHAAVRSLVARLGMPDAIQDQPVRGNRLVQWRVPDGLVEFNRDPGWDPLGWSAVYWTAEAPPGKPLRR